MTTITSDPDAVAGPDGATGVSGGAVDGAPGEPGSDPAHRIRQMDLVRRFVAQIAAGQDRAPTAPVSSEPAGSGTDWEELWATADGEESVERAIARIALRANRLLPGTVLPGPDGGGVEPAATVVAGTDRTEPPGARRRQLMITAATWVRNIGVLIMLFAAWQLWGTGIAQHHEQSTLRHQFESKVHHVATPAVPASAPLIPETTVVPDEPEGTVDAHLQIPAIGLDQYVVAGTADADLAKGPGHYTGTAMPGQAGNVAIAGHRTTHGAPFNRLGQLVVGDHIYLTTLTGRRLTYVVAQTPYPVSPSNVTVLNNFGDDRLTLTTCNPEYSSAQRLIVVADYQPAGGVVADPGVTLGAGAPYRVQGAGEAGWNFSSMPWFVLEMGLLITLGLVNRRLSGAYGRVRWLVLVPVWTALIYALFETLTNFLPAAV